MLETDETTEVKREMARYRQFMLEHEYTARTATVYCTYLLRFLNWPAREDVYSLREKISGFLGTQCIGGTKSFKGCRAALYLYYKMATGKSCPKRPPKECNPEAEAILGRFYDYSVSIKHIRPSSAVLEVAFLRSFFEYLTTGGTWNLEGITAHSIRAFAVGCLSHFADSSKGRAITAIRNFLRFQQFEGVPVHRSAFQLPISPAVWKNASFPKTMDEEVFSSLHTLPDTNTPTGKRDRCIILCFTELALRCIEVASLCIDDFNWREGTVVLKNTKTRLDRKLPVSRNLGQAIIEYLRNARPQTASRIVFVRFKHNRGEPMGVSQIRGVVRRVYAKTGVKMEATGTHILRRTAATKLYNAGNSLKMTADILGHESLDSTARYVKTNITGLRQVAAPWPQMMGKAGIHDVK
jgi:site-specific recombinase XerD